VTRIERGFVLQAGTEVVMKDMGDGTIVVKMDYTTADGELLYAEFEPGNGDCWIATGEHLTLADVKLRSPQGPTA
jgi:hypothetical protein